jgi:hypothetical protein
MRWFYGFAIFCSVSKMSKKIENPAECEVPAVIRFLNAQNVRPIEIYRQLIAAYGEGVMNESNVRKWCRMFNEGRINVPGARPSSLRTWKIGLINTSGQTGVSLFTKYMRNFLIFLFGKCTSTMYRRFVDYLTPLSVPRLHSVGWLNERWIGHVFGRRRLWPYRGTTLVFAWRKPTKNFSQNGRRCPTWDSKRATPEYKSRALPLETPCSVGCRVLWLRHQRFGHTCCLHLLG